MGKFYDGDDNYQYFYTFYDRVERLIMISSDREITEEDLMDCSSFELSAVRNGIYAVHGYIFQTQEWNDFFSDFDWYRPNPDFKQNQISGTESKNASFIRGYEEEIYGGIYSF